MRYTQFRIENYKGVEQLTLRLTGDVTTLIGLNESGKTTILEAIYCFSYGKEDLGALTPGLESLRDPERWIPIAERANFNRNIVIEATIALDDEDKAAYRTFLRSQLSLTPAHVPDEITVEERYKFSNSRHQGTSRFWSVDLQGTVGRQRKAREFTGETREWQAATDWLAERLPRILYFPNFLFDLPETFKLTDDGKVSAQEQRDKNTIYRSTFEQILAVLDNGADLQTHVVKRLASNERADQRSLDALLLDMGRVLTRTVFGAWNRIFGREPAAQEVEFIPDPAGEAAVALRLKGPDGYYDLSERSLGFRWFFMFLMMTSFYKSSENGQRALFLLDEPASNLHSKAQAELLTSFEDLLSRVALVYTTHSHHLINVRWLDQAYVVKNAALGSLDFSDYLSSRMGTRTSVSATLYRRFVVDHPDQTTYFQPVLDLLDYRPSVLEPIPTAVLVEGKSDFYLLRYVRDVLGVATDLHFVPGTGASSLDAVIRLHIGWAKPFVVLLDGDSEGIRQRSRYVAEFGAILRDRCLLLPEVVGRPDCKEAEDLLSAADKSALLQAVHEQAQLPSPTKKNVNNAIQEALVGRVRAPFSAETMSRFIELHEALASTLREQL